MTRPTLQISRAQFRTNIAAVERRIAPSTLMLVMKDDAYGHGLGWAVEDAAAAGVTWFGGYDIHTALRIRQAAALRFFVAHPLVPDAHRCDARA